LLGAIALPEIINKVHYLTQNDLGILDWSEKVYNFVEGLENI
jgi:hypothetical protein